MQRALQSEIIRLLLSLLAVFTIGWLIGDSLYPLLLFLVLYLSWQMWNAWRLLSWVKDKMKTEAPGLGGIWGYLILILHNQKRCQTELIGRMRQAVRRVSQLNHAIEEGIVVLRDDLSLYRWNRAAQSQLGLQSSDRGHPISSLIRDPAFAEYLNQKDIRGRIDLPSRANPGRWLMFTASHFGDGNIVLVISDITPLKNTERLRKEFVGNVSHELRTPITVLRGYLETLSDRMQDDNPQTQKALEQMSEQVMRMQALADDLLVLSRLESQPEKTKLEEIELAPLLNGILDEAGILSERGNHRLKLDCPENAVILAQHGDIHSAISNLVINAVHHNPEGANIHVSVTSGEDEVSISVRDDGIGISSDVIPRLTERFYRTDSSRSSGIGGSGLGLAIVKHVVNRYGGELEINSRLREGAEFICTFPLKSA